MFPQVFDDGAGAERRKGHGESLGCWAMYILTWDGCDLNKDDFATIVWELYPSSDFLTLDSLFEGPVRLATFLSICISLLGLP